MQNLVAISTGVHPFCPPDDFRRVHFCPEKSGLIDVRIGACVFSKRSSAREKYQGGAGVIKQKGRFGLFCLPPPGKMPAVTPDLDRARIKLKRIRPKKCVFKGVIIGPNPRWVA